MRRVNVRVGHDGVHRAFVAKPNALGETRHTYCNLGAEDADDTTDPVDCGDCLRAVPLLEIWVLTREEDQSITTPKGGP